MSHRYCRSVIGNQYFIGLRQAQTDIQTP